MEKVKGLERVVDGGSSSESERVWLERVVDGGTTQDD